MDRNTHSRKVYAKSHPKKGNASMPGETLDEFLTHLGLSEKSKLSVMDLRRIITFQPSYERNVLGSIEEIVYRWLRRISEHDYKASILLCEELDRYQKEGSNSIRISGRDVLFGIWKCCDSFLQQDITRKSITCKNPVPVLSPEHQKGKITFHLFGLRKSTILVNDAGKKLHREFNVTTNLFVHISALRFGKICVSKCQILNKLLASWSGDNEDCFITHSQDTENRIWSKGTVEGAWCFPNKVEMFQNVTTPVGLFALRGNAFKYKVQTDFCSLISNVLLIFTNYQNAAKASKILQTINTPTKVIFLIFPTESKTTGNLNIESSYEVFEVKENAPLEVIQFLHQSLSKIFCDISITPNKTLEQNVDVCNELNIIVDELQSESSRAKQLAYDTVNKVKLALEKNQEVFVLQKLSKELQPPDDKVVKTDGSKKDKFALPGSSFTLLLKRQAYADLTKSMIKFLHGIIISDNEYFFSWLQIFLDQEFLNLQGSFERNLTRNDTNHRQSGERLRTEHFLRELELMFECSHPYLQKEEHCLEKLIAETVLKGFSFEISYDDVNTLPSKWVESVFSQLLLLLQQDVQILTVSILGSSRSSNMYLLNQIFGVNFTAEGKHPSGLQIKFVNAHFTQPLTGKAFLIIADSDTFNICTDSVTSSLIPAVFCLSDLIIFNITEEEKTNDINRLCKFGVSSLLFTEEIRKMFSVDCTRREFPVCCAVKHCEESGHFLKDDYSKIVLSKLKDTAEEMMSFALIDQGRKQEVFTNIIKSFAHNERYNNHDEEIYCFTLRESRSKLHPTKEHLSDLGRFRLHVASVLGKLPRSNLVQFNKGIADIKKRGKVMDSFYRRRQNLHDNFMEKIKLTNYRRMTSSFEGKIKMNNTALEKLLHYAPFLMLRQGTKEDDLDWTAFKTLKISDKTKRQMRFTKTLLSTSKMEFRSEYFYQNLNTWLISACDKHSYPDIKMSWEMTTKKLSKKLKGTLVNNVFPTLTISNCSVPPTQIESKVDIYEYATNIFERTELFSNRIQEFDNILRDMSHNHECFEQNMPNVAKRITTFVKEVADITSIESGSLYLFLLSKYVYDTNRSQLDSELHSISKAKGQYDLSGAAVRYMIKDTEETHKVITYPSYIMKHAEPLKFPDLKTKINYIVATLKHLISDSEHQILETFLTFEDVQKYSRLPVNVLSFQIVDRYLFRLLPKLSENELKILSCLMRDVKVMVIGKTLATKVLKCDELYDEIHEAIINAPISKHEKDRQRAAVLSHLVAWASYFIAAKELEENKEEFIEIVVNTSKNAVSILLQKQLQNKEDDLVVKGLCNAFRRNLNEIIEIGLLSRLIECMRTKNQFQRKLNFIGMSLRSLLECSEWTGFIRFLKNFDNFSNSWILTFLANECNKKDDSLIQNLLQTTVNIVVTKAINDVNSVRENVKSITDPNSRERINKLCKLFEEHCSTYCDKSDLAVLEGVSSVKDFISLLTKFMNELESLKEELIQSFKIPTEGNLHSTKLWLLRLPGELHKDLYEAVKGCVKQCPFCGVVCANEKKHDHRHNVAHHAPTGLKGNNFEIYNELQWRVCEHLVSHALTKYRSYGVENKFRKYKEDFPKWKINPNKNAEPSKFWKYVFVNFNKEFAEFYECEEGFPERWQNVPKEEALQSLKDMYKLN